MIKNKEGGIHSGPHSSGVNKEGFTTGFIFIPSAFPKLSMRESISIVRCTRLIPITVEIDLLLRFIQSPNSFLLNEIGFKSPIAPYGCSSDLHVAPILSIISFKNERLIACPIEGDLLTITGEGRTGPLTGARIGVNIRIRQSFYLRVGHTNPPLLNIGIPIEEDTSTYTRKGTLIAQGHMI